MIYHSVLFHAGREWGICSLAHPLWESSSQEKIDTVRCYPDASESVNLILWIPGSSCPGSGSHLLAWSSVRNWIKAVWAKKHKRWNPEIHKHASKPVRHRRSFHPETSWWQLDKKDLHPNRSNGIWSSDEIAVKTTSRIPSGTAIEWIPILSKPVSEQSRFATISEG